MSISKREYFCPLASVAKILICCRCIVFNLSGMCHVNKLGIEEWERKAVSAGIILISYRFPVKYLYSYYSFLIPD